MKYGEHFEEESVPEWSIHNLDYNTLKDTIKTHTTKASASASAIAIPGQTDYALKKFEDGFYLELCHQHDRVNLFVNNKAGEITRRLDYLSTLVHRLILQCAENDGEDRPTFKQRRRFAKFDRQVDACGSDLKSLERFVTAQVTGFRKLLKKYKKWTGSSNLGIRFKENVLSSPKSFAKRNFHSIHFQQRQLQEILKTTSPRFEAPISPVYDEMSSSETYPIQFKRHDDQQTHPRQPNASAKKPSSIYAPRRQPQEQQPMLSYWNEYEHGEEAPCEDSYVIYVDPNAPDFLDFSALKTAFTKPVDIVRHWLRRDPSRDSDESRTLIGSSNGGHSPFDYLSINHGNNSSSALNRPMTGLTTDNETDDEYASSEDQYSPTDMTRRDGYGYLDYESRFLAFPNIEDQKLIMFREKLLTRATILAYMASLALLIVSGVLITTGKHKKHLEVEAGVMVGCVFSLFAGCVGLGTGVFARHERGGCTGWLPTSIVWATFLTVCILNALLLVIVVGNNA